MLSSESHQEFNKTKLSVSFYSRCCCNRPSCQGCRIEPFKASHGPALTGISGTGHREEGHPCDKTWEKHVWLTLSYFVSGSVHVRFNLLHMNLLIQVFP